MKFSVSLSTGFEGVMYPIPVCGSRDFVRLAKLCERLGYHSVWGNDHITTQAMFANCFPDQPPNFYEVLTVLSFWPRRRRRCKLRHGGLRPADARSVLARQAGGDDRPDVGRAVHSRRRHRRLPRGVRGLGAADSKRSPARRHAGRGLAVMQRLFAEARVTPSRQVLRLPRHRDGSRSRCRSRFRSNRRPQYRDVERAARVAAPAGCPAGVLAGAGGAHRDLLQVTAPRSSAAIRPRSRSRRSFR